MSERCRCGLAVNISTSRNILSGQLQRNKPSMAKPSITISAPFSDSYYQTRKYYKGEGHEPDGAKQPCKRRFHGFILPLVLALLFKQKKSDVCYRFQPTNSETERTVTSWATLTTLPRQDLAFIATALPFKIHIQTCADFSHRPSSSPSLPSSPPLIPSAYPPSKHLAQPAPRPQLPSPSSRPTTPSLSHPSPP